MQHASAFKPASCSSPYSDCGAQISTCTWQFDVVGVFPLFESPLGSAQLSLFNSSCDSCSILVEMPTFGLVTASRPSTGWTIHIQIRNCQKPAMVGAQNAVRSHRSSLHSIEHLQDGPWMLEAMIFGGKKANGLGCGNGRSGLVHRTVASNVYTAQHMIYVVRCISACLVATTGPGRCDSIDS